MRKIMFGTALIGLGAAAYFTLGARDEKESSLSASSVPAQQQASSVNERASGPVMPRRMRAVDGAAQGDAEAQAQELGNRLDGRMRRSDRNTRRADMVARFDANGDGELNDEERDLLRASFAERRGARDLEFFDGDGDGVLDEDELAMKDQARTEMMTERVSQMLINSDTDADGRISRREAESSDRRMQRLLADFESVDGDGDDFISPEELQQAMATRRGGRGARGGQAPANSP